MSMIVRLTALLFPFVVACAETPTIARDTSGADGQPDGGKPEAPGSGRCYSDIDCKGNGFECLMEGKDKGPGTCVRMDPAIGPNGLPHGPCGISTPCN